MRTRALPFLLACGLLFSCVPDAPHDNTLDPASPVFDNSGTISGKVVRFGAPTVGVSSAFITVSPGGASAMTPTTGEFTISRIPAGSITVVVSKQGFQSDTIRLAVEPGQVLTLESRLDALPQIANSTISTKKIDQWWPGPVYNAFVSAAVTDPDGQADLDSVYCTVDTVSFQMVYSVGDKLFEVSISSDVLPTGNLQWLVGKPMTVYAHDRSRAIGSSDQFYVSRIIESEAVPTLPAPPADTVRDSLVFEWDPPASSTILFPHTYKIEVVRVDAGTQTSLWSKSDISSSPPYSYQYPLPLQTGSYFWAISIVDEYGNVSRSREATYTVP